jgi:hypothetical protein
LAADDHAILVAISKYRDDARYPDLEGPLNDYQSFHDWLLDENGGDVPDTNIHFVVTDEIFASMPTPRPENAADLEWEPSKKAFTKKMEKVIQHPQTGAYVARPGARLYMYFAGHGFSSDWESLQSAALVPADVFGSQMDDIPGTVYMEGIRKMALYSEIVLIMDCCRTLMRTGTYSVNVFRPFTSDEQENVSVLSAYAVPKDGSAQERILPEAGNKPVGLLTHSFLRAIKEVPPDILGQVSDNAIDQYLSNSWRTWYPDNYAPPKPRIYPPPSAQKRIFFKSGRQLIEQTFSVLRTPHESFEFELFSPSLPRIRATFEDNLVHWERPMDSASHLDLALSEPGPDGRQTFNLMLLPEQYRVDFGIDSPLHMLTFSPGGARVDL